MILFHEQFMALIKRERARSSTHWPTDVTVTGPVDRQKRNQFLLLLNRRRALQNTKHRHLKKHTRWTKISAEVADSAFLESAGFSAAICVQDKDSQCGETKRLTFYV